VVAVVGGGSDATAVVGGGSDATAGAVAQVVLLTEMSLLVGKWSCVHHFRHVGHLLGEKSGVLKVAC